MSVGSVPATSSSKKGIRTISARVALTFCIISWVKPPGSHGSTVACASMTTESALAHASSWMQVAPSIAQRSALMIRKRRTVAEGRSTGGRASTDASRRRGLHTIVFKLTPLQARRCGEFFRCELRLFWRADLPVRPSMHISHSGRSTISGTGPRD